MKGDVKIGRGASQRELSRNRYWNTYKVVQVGREPVCHLEVARKVAKQHGHTRNSLDAGQRQACVPLHVVAD